MKTRLLFALAVVVAVFAVPASAQERQCDDGFYAEVQLCGGGGGGWAAETSWANGDYLDNPCTAAYDPFWVEYEVNVFEEGWQTDTAEAPVRFTEETAMGGTYAASGTSVSEVAANQPYTLRKYHKVNTSDAFHVVTVIDFYPSTRETFITRETACGNGMPDSAQ